MTKTIGILTIIFATIVLVFFSMCKSWDEIGTWAFGDGQIKLMQSGPISFRGETRKELVIISQNGSYKRYVIDETHAGYKGPARLMRTWDWRYLWLLVRHSEESTEAICAILVTDTDEFFSEPDIQSLKISSDAAKFSPRLHGILEEIENSEWLEVDRLR